MATKTKKTKVEAPKSQVKSRTVWDYLTEPSTWFGVLTIGAALATGGTASWLNPQTVPALAAGLGLILAKEQKSPGTPAVTEKLEG